jgi:signal transduction histidine kinase/HAMP domain-containing protein
MKNMYRLKNILTFYFILTACLSIFCIGFISLYLLKDSLQKKIVEKNQLIAESLSSEIELFLRRPVQILMHIEDIVNQKKLILPEDINSYLDVIISNYKEVEMLRVIRGDGKIKYLAPYDEDILITDISGQPFFQHQQKQSGIYWSETFLSMQTGQPTLTVSIPFHGGIIAGYINLSTLFNVIQKITLDSTGYAWVVDKNGIIIAHPNKMLVSQRTSIKHTDIFQRTASGDEQTFEYSAADFGIQDDTQYLGSIAIVPQTGWIVVFSQSSKEAYANIQKLRVIIIVVGFLSVVLAGFLASQILKRTLQPLYKLNKATRNIGEGSYNNIPYENTYEEISELLNTFNSMVDSIKTREQSLRESEEKLNALFTSLTEMIVMHELVLNDAGEAIDYRIIDCNKVFTEVTGIRKEDAIGKLASEVYQTDPPPHLEEYAKVGLGGDPHEFNIFYPPLDKHFMISVVSPQAGKFATITTDISDMMQIQEMIIAKNKEMENYLYVASHDLRTPLVNIQGFSQRLKKQADSIKTLFADKTLEPEILHQLGNITDEDIPKTLGFILGNIEKMDTLINGLLQLSRTGRVEMNIQEIDMNALFAKILQSLDFQIKEAQCEIHIDPLPECFGDAALLDQLFSNIISNALKHSDSQRALEIIVDAKKIHNRVVYAIRDTGKGIAQKHLDKIWDVFYRIDPRSGKTGEGIGLSVVKRIAEKHKGKVWAESEENKGSVFHIELNNRSFTEF